MAAGSVSATSRSLLRAATYAAVLSGAPSTIAALLSGDDPLSATRAAGRLLAPHARRDLTVLGAAAIAHGALSLGWTVVLQRLPRGLGRAVGYGVAIAALDLGLAHVVRGERFGPIAALPVLPQVADHIAFAVIARAAFSASGDDTPESSRRPARCA